MIKIGVLINLLGEMQNSNQKEEISRYDLKKQLEGIQSFDISSFGESKNQSTTNLKGFTHPTSNHSLFPNIDAPTLELLEDSEYNIRYLDQGAAHQTKPKLKTKKHESSNKQFYEDLTARNTTTVNKYEERIQQMKKDLEKMAQKLDREKKQKLLLHQKITLLEQHHKKTIDELKEKNKQQKEQIKLLKEREIKTLREKQTLEKELAQIAPNKNYPARQSRAGSVSSGGGSSLHSNTLMTSYIQDPSYFCPQLLSPEQTVVLLSKLLKKVSKSSKMIKELTQDQSVKTILSKIQKK